MPALTALANAVYSCVSALIHRQSDLPSDSAVKSTAEVLLADWLAAIKPLFSNTSSQLSALLHRASAITTAASVDSAVLLEHAVVLLDCTAAATEVVAVNRIRYVCVLSSDRFCWLYIMALVSVTGLQRRRV